MELVLLEGGEIEWPIGFRPERFCGNGKILFSLRTRSAACAHTSQETTLAIKSNEEHLSAARARAEASFKKEERAKDGALAMTEYLAQGRVARERMEQLKALRLAREAAEQAAAATKAAEKKAAVAQQPAPAKRARKG
jgi:hypothetical protein